MGFELDPSYKDVPTRIADFREKHPEGCLRPVNPDRPFDVVYIGDKTFLTYSAAAFRTPDDPTPGIGVAWEPFPGHTPYTKNSELQNAETSAWGRAIVAVLASESKAIASAEDVRNRRDAERVDPELEKQRADIKRRAEELPPAKVDELKEWVTASGLPAPWQLTRSQAEVVTEWLDKATAEPESEQAGLDGKKAKEAANEAYEAQQPKGEE